MSSAARSVPRRSPASAGHVLVERDGTMGWIRINRPERLNAFFGRMRQEIEAALGEFEQDDAVRCVIITGVGRAFSTGGDASVMAELIEAGDEAAFETQAQMAAFRSPAAREGVRAFLEKRAPRFPR
ncbi:MAG: enoyl-CoA hydratase/isomerase family protein [Gemmatimonadetes bacterium]|nr:enoyl-CoA hydratase/isomerase family protein [Gemmatimonadota bacterium]